MGAVNRTRQVAALIVSMAVLLSCDDSPTAPSPPVAMPTPAPAPTPTPEATPAANQAPTVRVTGGGGCHPSPRWPCTVSFKAHASDPDGDPIAYGWDGCAQGNAPSTTCTITAPGTVTATVLVADGRGGFARASATAEGFNEAPVIRFGDWRPPNPAPSNTFFSIVGGQPEDPDGDDDPNQLCKRVSLLVSGPCRAGVALCGGVADAFDIDLTTLQGPGTCVLEARVADFWGAVGVARLRLDVR